MSEEKYTEKSQQSVDVQQTISTAIAEERKQAAGQLEEATGYSSLAALKEATLLEGGNTKQLLEQSQADLSKITEKYHQSQKKSAILSACKQAEDPEIIEAMLLGKAECDENGVVTVDGLPMQTAVDNLLKQKPILALPEGSDGSGAPKNPVVATVNPWKEESFNLTEQIAIKKQNPSLAAELQAAASEQGI